MKLGTNLLALTFAFAAVTGVYTPVARAQSQNPAEQQPAQPAQPQQPEKSADDKSAKSGEDQLPTPPVVAGTSNDAPLTGASMPIIGLVASRSYFVPSVFFFGQLDSNASNSAGNYHFASINTIMGSVAVQKLGRASQLNLGYLAGRSFSSQHGEFNSTTHEAVASELWSRGRWDGFIFDKLLYSSQAGFLGGSTPFDVAGLNNVAGLAGTGSVTLRSTFLPGQGIFTPFGPRLSNDLVAQVNNHLSRRTFFTLVGDYNILHFSNSTVIGFPATLPPPTFKLIDSSSAGFQGGLGYQLSRRDTFAVIYRFNDLWFSGTPVSIKDNTIQAAYQRQVGERLLLQLGAGPEISFIHDPDLAGTGAAGTRVSWTLDGLVHYSVNRGLGMTAGYDHFLSSGSGVFLGAISDRVFVGLNQQLSRAWILDANVSYAHNRNLVPLFSAATLVVPANSAYDSVYGGFEFHRRLGRDSDLFFGYLGRYQTSSFALCPQGICLASNVVGHQFNFGFAWHLRPVPIG